MMRAGSIWRWLWVGCLGVLCACSVVEKRLPAFPGAEGFGMYSQGGRGGRVTDVTNLNDSGQGSLRAAVESSGPRTVVFRVSGNIQLKSRLTIEESYITIAGQTAPGDGICLMDYPLAVSASHVIVRYIRSRPANNTGHEHDGMSVSKGRHIIIDHCSASWSVDEVLSVTSGSDDPPGHTDSVTVQWTFITEGLNAGGHHKGNHGYGSLVRGSYGNSYSFHHNLYAHHIARLPRPGNYISHKQDPEGLIFDFRNNVVYNWGGNHAGYNADNERQSVTRMNFIGNWYIAGIDSRKDIAYSADSRWNQAWFADNAMNGAVPDEPLSLVNLEGFTAEEREAWMLQSPLPVAPVTTDSPADAFQRVLASAGASVPHRDAIDLRIVNDIRQGGGRIIDDESDVGGWPELHSATPPTDKDGDGMPDSWEIERGLAPDNPSDGSVASSVGYTNLEVYLNSLIP